MYRICKDCGVKVNYSINEKNVPDYCLDCNLVIAKGRYEKNIKNGKTLFGTVGTNLGHNVMIESIIRFYKEQNPYETVCLLPHDATLNFIENYKEHSGFDKLFWADVSGIEPPDDPRVIRYSFARECTAIAELGYYPEWESKEEINSHLDILNKEKFIVLHARNIDGVPSKNITDNEYFTLLTISGRIYLKSLKKIKTLIVGNDYVLSVSDIVGEPFVDLRRKLSLDQIAWLCGHDNCIATIGKDSGILHLAAAAGSKVVGFGYQSEHWFPKAESGRVHCFIGSKGWNKFLDFIEKLA